MVNLPFTIYSPQLWALSSPLATIPQQHHSSFTLCMQTALEQGRFCVRSTTRGPSTPSTSLWKRPWVAPNESGLQMKGWWETRRLIDDRGSLISGQAPNMFYNSGGAGRGFAEVWSDPGHTANWHARVWGFLCLCVCVYVLITIWIKGATVDINKDYFSLVTHKYKPKKLKNKCSIACLTPVAATFVKLMTVDNMTDLSNDLMSWAVFQCAQLLNLND